MIARRLALVSCLVFCLAGCWKPPADAAELTSGDPGATATRAEWEAVADLPDCPPSRWELVLEDGRVVRGSPTHPAADGTPLETITVGASLDGSRVLESRLLSAPVSETFDVLPAGETGIYWADGVRLRSTIPPVSASMLVHE